MSPTADWSLTPWPLTFSSTAQPGSLPATTDHMAAVARALDVELLARCVEARAAVYAAVAREGLSSRAARRALYR